MDAFKCDSTLDYIKTSYNSGLKQWLIPDFHTENPIPKGMFC